ncbi:DUF397 domain-containing protein [Streptomyces albus subsp. chlorinus]|uniref:DUF397 domain-containing protein n=1 Tax=Streptomyces albus TaxID=1888 RepID=UPI00156FF18E|nr:DUF397 domain-containing protein [Streptomyces albus]NSC23274.1 DUF397 domain-containing protein [Streptomyces albus subsp. chlorinus]
MIDLNAATWRKSSYSGPTNDDCVEVAVGIPGRGGTVVPVRDSKFPQGPVLLFGRSAWSSFIERLGD